jgi:hypothetical protein
VVGLVNEKAAIARELIHRHAVNERMLAIHYEEDANLRRSLFRAAMVIPYVSSLRTTGLLRSCGYLYQG